MSCFRTLKALIKIRSPFGKNDFDVLKSKKFNSSNDFFLYFVVAHFQMFFFFFFQQSLRILSTTLFHVSISSISVLVAVFFPTGQTRYSAQTNSQQRYHEKITYAIIRSPVPIT